MYRILQPTGGYEKKYNYYKQVIFYINIYK